MTRGRRRPSGCEGASRERPDAFDTSPIADHADVPAALLRIVVTGERQRSAAAIPDWQKGRPWTDNMVPASTDDLDVAGLAVHPVGTACCAELRRIGHALYAANPHEDMAALSVEIAEMNLTHTGWRAILLETAWHRIGAQA